MHLSAADSKLEETWQDDDYDPRKPEYIIAASPEEVEEARVALTQRQIEKLHIASARAQDTPAHVRRHYRRVLVELEGQLPPQAEKIKAPSPKGPAIQVAAQAPIGRRSTTAKELVSCAVRAAGGGCGNACGKTAGAFTGILLGFVPAPVTFGLSIPLGAAFGLCIGAAVSAEWLSHRSQCAALKAYAF